MKLKQFTDYILSNNLPEKSLFKKQIRFVVFDKIKEPNQRLLSNRISLRIKNSPTERNTENDNCFQ